MERDVADLTLLLILAIILAFFVGLLIALAIALIILLLKGAKMQRRGRERLARITASSIASCGRTKFDVACLRCPAYTIKGGLGYCADKKLFLEKKAVLP